MRGKPSTDGLTAIDRERLTRARSSQARIAILEVLSIDGKRPLSPAEIAFELQDGIGTVRYHARILEILGLVEVVGTRLDEGSQERFYRLGARRPDYPSPAAG